MTAGIRIIFSIFFLSPCLSYAQEQTSQNFISQGLTRSLSELKSSVDELSSSNETLALKNAQLKARVNSLQMGLPKLSQENQELTNTKLKLDGDNPARTKQIEHLGRNISDLDHKIDALKEQIKITKDGLDHNENEEQKLSGQMTQNDGSFCPC